MLRKYMKILDHLYIYIYISTDSCPSLRLAQKMTVSANKNPSGCMVRAMKPTPREASMMPRAWHRQGQVLSQGKGRLRRVWGASKFHIVLFIYFGWISSMYFDYFGWISAKFEFPEDGAQNQLCIPIDTNPHVPRHTMENRWKIMKMKKTCFSMRSFLPHRMLPCNQAWQGNRFTCIHGL